MEKDVAGDLVHPEGEQPAIADWHATAETFAGWVHVEWDNEGQVMPPGQLPFFIDYLKQGDLFDGGVADCPPTYLIATLIATAQSRWTARHCSPMRPRLV